MLDCVLANWLFMPKLWKGKRHNGTTHTTYTISYLMCANDALEKGRSTNLRKVEVSLYVSWTWNLIMRSKKSDQTWLTEGNSWYLV